MKPRVSASPPSGYGRGHAGGTEIVAQSELLQSVMGVVRERTLYAYAAAQPTARILQGRGPVYVVPLPEGGPVVVVRHSRHGGLLAPITRDRFLRRTRAPAELAISLRLAALGIPTPTVVAYAVYPAGPGCSTSDVATRLIEQAADLGAVLGGADQSIPRGEAVQAATALLVAMARAGVRHPDLNLKNILVASTESDGVRAYLLDVDRVDIEHSRALAAAANAARLVRSATKWRERHGASISDSELAALEAAALGQAP